MHGNYYMALPVKTKLARTYSTRNTRVLDLILGNRHTGGYQDRSTSRSMYQKLNTSLSRVRCKNLEVAIVIVWLITSRHHCLARLPYSKRAFQIMKLL